MVVLGTNFFVWWYPGANAWRGRKISNRRWLLVGFVETINLNSLKVLKSTLDETIVYSIFIVPIRNPVVGVCALWSVPNVITSFMTISDLFFYYNKFIWESKRIELEGQNWERKTVFFVCRSLISSQRHSDFYKLGLMISDL